jgi:hypothetical protein
MRWMAWRAISARPDRRGRRRAAPARKCAAWASAAPPPVAGERRAHHAGRSRADRELTGGFAGIWADYAEFIAEIWGLCIGNAKKNFGGLPLAIRWPIPRDDILRAARVPLRRRDARHRRVAHLRAVHAVLNLAVQPAIRFGIRFCSTLTGCGA